MKRNSNGSMNLNTNGNVVRTRMKLFDSKDNVIAIFATGNGWSDGKCSETFLTGGTVDVDGKPTPIIGILPAPKAVIEGAVNDKDEFIISHRFMDELYGFWNHPDRNGEMTEAILKKIKTVLKSKGCRFELVRTQAQIKREAVLAMVA